jgi:hypothetical protein
MTRPVPGCMVYYRCELVDLYGHDTFESGSPFVCCPSDGKIVFSRDSWCTGQPVGEAYGFGRYVCPVTYAWTVSARMVVLKQLARPPTSTRTRKRTRTRTARTGNVATIPSKVAARPLVVPVTVRSFSAGIPGVLGSPRERRVAHCSISAPVTENAGISYP